jgi:hypothetical protein
MREHYLDEFSEDYDSLEGGEDLDDYAEDLSRYYREMEMRFFEEELEALGIDTGYAEFEPEWSDEFADLAESFREGLHENYQFAPSEDIEYALFNVMETMTPAEGFNFAKALSQIGKAGQQVLQDPTVSQIAKTALPVAGATIGTIYGGPIGTAIGGQLGQAAASAFSGKPASAAKPAAVAKPPQAKAVPASPQAGSTAAAQLLQLTQNPDVLKSLLALALGSQGKQSIPVGQRDQKVQLGAVMNMLNALTTQAASDADELMRESQDTTAYLRDNEGEFLVDPYVPEERAQALYAALLNAENQRLTFAEADGKRWSDFFPFAKGATLLVEYETLIRNFDVGQARVLKRTANELEVKIHIDRWDRFNVPQTDATISIVYRREGTGNQAVVVVNGVQYTDTNVTIHSNRTSRQIGMSIEILNQKVDRITIAREDADEARIKFKAGGDTHVLILSRK